MWVVVGVGQVRVRSDADIQLAAAVANPTLSAAHPKLGTPVVPRRRCLRVAKDEKGPPERAFLL